MPDKLNIRGETFTNKEMCYLEWQKDSCRVGGFSSSLFNTIHRADCTNREKLRTVFPDEVAAVEAWTEGDLHDRAVRAGLYK